VIPDQLTDVLHRYPSTLAYLTVVAYLTAALSPGVPW
jgi:hypothetical protein